MKGCKFVYHALICICISLSSAVTGFAADAPMPLLKQGQPVNWWFMFKLNAAKFPGCGGNAVRTCIFGGIQDYSTFGQQFAYASNDNASLQQGSGCAGDSVNDPLGATFSEIYNSPINYVIWNDQFYSHPVIDDCKNKPQGNCFAPWGHSKGMLAWNDDGDGFVIQVTTPSWPAAGSTTHPREGDGNTLGCVTDNDVLVSQHFFALKVNKSDISIVLKALQNASVVTDPANPQIVSVKDSDRFKGEVSKLGKKSTSVQYTKDKLSSGVVLISKPSRLHVPPWQMVSALLNRAPLRAATWWTKPAIYSTTKSTAIDCWDDSLGADKGMAVQIATTGEWSHQVIGLTGGLGQDKNHAKIGVSTEGGTYTILGDMNQQGAISGNCASSQNGRGGLFYVLDDPTLFENVTNLIKGDSAPAKAPTR